MSDTGSDKSSETTSTNSRVGTPDLEDAVVNMVLDIAKEMTSIAEAGSVVPKEVASVGSLIDSGSKGLIEGAEGVTARIAELEATMNKAISLIDTTKAGSSPEETDIANAIKSAINELEPWRDIATGETLKAKAAKEEVEALKSEVENLRRELDIANAKVLAAEEQVTTQAIEPNESSEGPGESLIEPSASSAQSYMCRTLFPIGHDSLSNNPALFNTKRLWPNGQIITYRFTDGHANQQAKVTKVIPEWSRYANITFKLVSNDALLRISFKNVPECWSYIGTDSQNTTMDVPYTMALGAVSKLPDITPGDRALILHQFGHVLGLVHEHVCPGETDAVSLKEGDILKHASFQDSGPLTSDHLGVYNNSSVTNYVSPDLSSIMIFSMPGELNEGNFMIEPNTELSPLDKAFMVINYPRTRVHSQAPEWTLLHALLNANVDDNTKRSMNEEPDLTKRRALFANYLLRARQQARPQLVHPTPKIVESLSTPAVQDALNTLLVNPDGRPGIKEVLADAELKEALIDVHNHLTTYPAVRKVVQEGKAAHVSKAEYDPPAFEIDKIGSDEPIVGSLLRTALMFHGATKHWGHSGDETDNTGPKQVNAATILYTHLAQHAIFRTAMERAVGEKASSTEVTPGVNVLLESLAERPAVLRAIRKALL